MDGTLDLKPLHGLYQVLNTAGGADPAFLVVSLPASRRSGLFGAGAADFKLGTPMGRPT